ncbi:MAG: hypothetical protein KJ069_29590 [Anaerolineae bacterium]|nr:hypothetical protein [Anaerolineae bacterium]
MLKGRVEVGNSPNSLALSSDGKFLAYASEKPDSNNKEVIEVILVDVETGETITRFDGFSKSLYALAFDPSDTILAAGSVDGSVRFWELDNEYRLTRLKFNNRERVWSIAFSPTRDEVLIGADHFTAVFPLSDILGR